MDENYKISESEWKIMHLLWHQSPLTIGDMVEQLDKDTGWKPRTIKTLISRLIQKGAVEVRAEGRSNLYYPLAPMDECVRNENASFLNKVYSGTLNRMFLSFIQQSELSNEDIDALKRILDEKKSNDQTDR